MVRTPALARLLKLNHALDVHNSPLPECTGCHIASALTTTLQLEFIKHLLAGLSTGLWWGKAKVAWDSGGTREKFVKLVIGDTTLTLLIGLNKAIEDEVVERCMLVGTWVVHCLLNKANVLFLGVIFHMIKANILCWDLWHVSHHMIIGPLNELVQAKHTTSWALLCVQGIKKDFVVDGTADSITNIQGSKTIPAREGSNFCKELIKLLCIDQTILVGVYITERQCQETIQLAFGLAGSWLRCLLGPGLEGLLIVAPMVCAPRAGREGARSRASSRSHRSEHDAPTGM